MKDINNIAILYSGGKDSTFALDYAMQRKWDIKYLLSIKPSRTDCYLFHFATVELTRDIAKILGIRHIYEECNIANPEKEAEMIKGIVERNGKIDALILGGVGLQKTQLAALQKALLPLNIEVFAPHDGYDHEDLFKEMLDKGYRVLITQVATDGGKRWLGREITKENFEEFKRDSIMYGYHIGMEGGYMDTLVIDAPIFNKKIEIIDSERVFESEYSGHLVINKYKIADKTVQEI